MNKIIKLFGRAQAWLRTVGEESVIDNLLPERRTSLSLMDDVNNAFSQSCLVAHEKPSVLRTRREKLLCRLVIREIRRTATSRYLTAKEQRRFPIYGIDSVFKSYLEKGFLYFSDCGISAESQFKFLELGEISWDLFRELKAVPDRLTHMLFEGDDRKEEYRRHAYDRLTRKFFDFERYAS